MLPNFPTSAGDINSFLLLPCCPHPISYRGQQYQLLEWLENVTFPTEAAFRDPEYAKSVYRDVIGTTISLGVSDTTRYFGSFAL